VVYTVASAGCALAPDLVSLSAFRFLAAVGGSASMVIPRAMVRDLADGHAAARLMSRLMLVMGAAPILAPTLGGLVLSVGSWRTIFWFATVYGVVCCVVVSLVLPDTLPARKRVRLGAYAQLARYGMIIRERGFITHAMMGGFAMFAMFAYIGGAPPVFIERFGFSPPEFGALFGCCAFGLILASQINPLVLPRFGANRLMRVAVRTAFAATLVLLVVALSAWGGWLATAAPIAVVVASQGFTNPNATVGALSRHAAHAGMASALMGTLQFLIGAISGVLVGLLDDGTARPLAFLMVLGMAGAVLCDYFRPRPT
jgi:DHA1 family bicyclomycin/chloramphenicol resistance-like MFS transporter